MADFVGFRTFQKLRYFLADAFPFLARFAPGAASVNASLRRYPQLAGLLARARSSTLVTSLQRALSTFVVGSYSSGRLDWTAVPRDAGAVLRTSIVTAALLTLLLPLAMTWAWPSLSAAAIAGSSGGAVAGWSVVVWFAAVSLGWGALLAGAGAAHWVLFLPAITLFLYFGAALVGALPNRGGACCCRCKPRSRSCTRTCAHAARRWRQQPRPSWQGP